MSRIYKDYLNETALTIPDKFIDVKTGETHSVSPIIREQIEYHARNNTLIHLLFSALNSYLSPQVIQDGGIKEILGELYEMKKMMQRGSFIKDDSLDGTSSYRARAATDELDMGDIDEVLEAFGG